MLQKTPSLLFPLLVCCVFGVPCCRAWAAIPQSLVSSKYVSGSLHPDYKQVRVIQISSTSSKVVDSPAIEIPSSDRLPYNWKNQWYAVTFANYVPYPSKSAEVSLLSYSMIYRFTTMMTANPYASLTLLESLF